MLEQNNPYGRRSNLRPRMDLSLPGLGCAGHYSTARERR